MSQESQESHAKNYMSDSIRRNEQRKKIHGTNGNIGTMKPESAKSAESAEQKIDKTKIVLMR